ncbi:MAG: hypothetical protein ACRETG_12595, partial [Steroidobacteraceae bacterium]
MSRCNFRPCLAMLIALASCSALAATSAAKAQDKNHESDGQKPDRHSFEPFKSEAVTSSGSVTIGGHAVAYE